MALRCHQNVTNAVVFGGGLILLWLSKMRDAGNEGAPALTLAGVAGWLLEIVWMYLVIEALGLSGPLSLIAITALFTAILSTVLIPGGVGFVEPGIVGLLLLSMGRQDAVSVALVDRSITFVSVIAIGAVIFLAVQIWQGRSARGKLRNVVGVLSEG